MPNTPVKPTAADDFLFDLNGYLVLKNAIPRSHIAELNAIVDGIPRIDPGQWHGYVHREQFDASRGIAYQQIYEAGEPFERLIDHPNYIEHVKRYVGGENSFDHLHGPLFIDENFVSLRGPHEAIAMHSGNWHPVKRCQYLVRNGQFMCGQINILIALTDIGPGDGATMVIPGSHKSNFKYPHEEQMNWQHSKSMDGALGAIEVYLNAGDAILFVDAICHGAAKRKNPGERRISVYRYGPSWGNFRFGYKPSEELLTRLTPEQRQIVYPWKHQVPPPKSSGLLASVGSESESWKSK
jgi:hypothetical protein